MDREKGGRAENDSVKNSLISAKNVFQSGPWTLAPAASVSAAEHLPRWSLISQTMQNRNCKNLSSATLTQKLLSRHIMMII